MLRAHDLDMTKGEYVFYTIEMLPDEQVLNAADVWASNDGRDIQAKQAFEAVFHVRFVAINLMLFIENDVKINNKVIPVIQVTLAALSNAAVNDFRKEVARRMLLPPWDVYVSDKLDVSQQ